MQNFLKFRNSGTGGRGLVRITKVRKVRRQISLGINHKSDTVRKCSTLTSAVIELIKVRHITVTVDISGVVTLNTHSTSMHKSFHARNTTGV